MILRNSLSMIFFIIQQVCASKIKIFTLNQERLFNPQDIPTVAYFDETTSPGFQRNYAVFEHVAQIGPNVTYLFVNCTRYPNECINKKAEPFPGIRLYRQNYPKPSLFINEHSAYAISEFVTHVTNLPNNIGVSNLKILTKDNYSYFETLELCSVTTYLNLKSQQSQVFVPSLHQLADVMKPVPTVQVAIFDCSPDIRECIRHGITVAPLVRVKNGENITYYDGFREMPYLLEFVNKNCQTFQGEDGLVNKTLLKLQNPSKYQEYEKFLKNYIHNKSLKIEAKENV